MCMDPATFMPDKALHHQCHTSNSDDPAVEADCPEECRGGSHLDEVDGTMKYHCGCRASSAEECAEKYPGEQAAEHRCNGSENHSPCNQPQSTLLLLAGPLTASRGTSCRRHDKRPVLPVPH